MSSRMSMTAAMLRKDAVILWPLAVITAVLVAWHTAAGASGFEDWRLLRIGLAVAAYSAGALLITAVIQSDAPSSVRHDWLIRPIPRSLLLAAKALLIIATLALPFMIGQVIAGVHDGKAPGEIFLAATYLQLWPAVVALCLIAALTSTVIEAGIVLVATILIAAVVLPISISASGSSRGLFGSGFDWVADETRFVIGMVTCCVLLWMAYYRRAIRTARITCITVVLLLMLSPVFTPARALFAVQKMLSPDPAAAAAIIVAPLAGCSPAIKVDPTDGSRVERQLFGWEGGQAPALAPGLWSPDQREEAGRNAVGFETRIAVTGVPDGWRARVNRVDGAYVSAGGRIVQKPLAAVFWSALRSSDSGAAGGSHFWLLSRTEYERLVATDVQLHLDYSLTLLRPTHVAELAIDGKRRHLDGFGYCSAVFDEMAGAVKVDCFKRGAQPAQLVATMNAGAATVDASNGFPDYTPAFLEGLTGRYHTIMLLAPQDRGDRVELTSYEAAAHFSREAVVPAVLGGSPAECPAP